MNLRLRKCLLSDLDSLVQISKETFVAAFEKDNNPKDFWDYVNSAFSREAIKAQLSNEHSEFYFVFEADNLVGYFKLNTTDAQTEFQDQHTMELERIYVKAQFQGSQVGSWMLQQAIQMARDAQKQYLWLGVWEHNPKAIRFYQRNGFTKFGTHPYFVGSDKQTDWLLRLEL
ncbi:GNAT family N-acetyltransferase [Flagellimonas allohymeniacidonis]|uniref:GNAT family N-acetyltransferase n=1 Tax=Flagellimonas allohymeniacidonis TaxID=2517819 RepID=A0A4Q8QB32_9FLAO|nr:GNAT family N-acetyltransferase [Allomuricauda hymeniacidonis]TAI47481.1 GNAT family N-acetyltransferase [Allomuricauda hymeniacidonis]